MKIVCVYKSGGDFDVRYVRALKAALTKFCPVPFDLYCLTDLSYEVEAYAKAIPLRHDWPGWWSKLELFNPELPFNQDNDSVLYFDLDVLILRDIFKLISLCKGITCPMMLRSSDTVGEASDWPSSSIMAWRGDMMSKVYSQVIKRGIEDVVFTSYKNIKRAGQRTDQGFIRTIIDPNKFQDFLPRGYIAFKYPHFTQNPRILETATILNWTGKPRFSKMPKAYDQIKMIWDEYSKYHKINQIL